MELLTRSGSHTFDDFCGLIRDDQKADLIDGVIYIASPESTEANCLFLWLASLMVDFAEVKDLGSVFGSRVAIRLDDRNGPEPDVLFVCKHRSDIVQKNHIDGPPDLVVEVVSPESVHRDYVTKRDLYQQFGIPEYWIIDEELDRIILHRLDRQGEYRVVRPRKGVLTSRAMPGFWLRIDWLWQETRPMKVTALAQLLGEDGEH